MKTTFRHLRQIEVFAKRCNFAKAAKELNISQPALSRSISSLEEQLGVPLTIDVEFADSYLKSPGSILTTAFLPSFNLTPTNLI